MLSQKKLMRVTIASAFALGLAACQFQPPAPQLTPVQIQAMQTQVFNANKANTYSAVSNALENMGYTIQNSDAQAGYMNVTGSAHSESGSDANSVNWHGLKICLSGGCDNADKVRVTIKSSGSVTVRPVGPDRTSVRLNFNNHKATSSVHGQNYEDDRQILDPKFYQGIFNQIRQSLFVGQSVVANGQ